MGYEKSLLGRKYGNHTLTPTNRKKETEKEKEVQLINHARVHGACLNSMKDVAAKWGQTGHQTPSPEGCCFWKVWESSFSSWNDWWVCDVIDLSDDCHIRGGDDHDPGVGAGAGNETC
eukprot:m.170002 g.170002  ORF g.170002 m.170002 type:complete len:118 (-) comp13485_c3_seq2:2521-2874(-)